MFYLLLLLMEPCVGSAPTTCRLQGGCSTSWANTAYIIYINRDFLLSQELFVFFLFGFRYRAISRETFLDTIELRVGAY